MQTALMGVGVPPAQLTHSGSLKGLGPPAHLLWSVSKCFSTDQQANISLQDLKCRGGHGGTR